MFYKIRLSPQGTVERTTRLPIAMARDRVDVMAASPDGNTLALGVQPDCPDLGDCVGPLGQLRVADVRTGRVTTWRPRSLGSISGLSLDRSGRFAAFSLRGADPQVRLLDLREPGRDPFGGRRVASRS